ncbi:hypothetical protein A2V61_03725 [Candidatus Woesebacteria bacterium RBG_19FT_COMBO_47_8]|uniref:Small ribosomal subunit protein bS20 n=1 Tax=Candidatus Woesebacteria bacterium RBG_13_46_13 TaxID=1802479 RepID=A0A1F7X542_9BACT|nr:MAG: hypothetical protein A2Y68_02160 [Candidatus Woesebacteria bacterium RBG_13_46_13]OGM16785.1 MAG: hypothetical protein A2V61_03725 [Candidatus Woesebacteria bacterium RBG_19FT_COMBO_47_8]HJX59197.1 30S ribosomal protein S20 [Patescibacteria group bacterium]
MPVTKTAKRALRVAKRKFKVNNIIRKQLEVAVRVAKKDKTLAKISAAIKLADRGAKKNVIHKNKASRIKKVLGRLTLKGKTITPSKKKAAKKKKK